VDTEPIRKLAESARKRGKDAHLEYQKLDSEANEHARYMRNLLAQSKRIEAQSKLNDAFYWFGHATAYKGIIAMAELATIVEDELDSEPTCP
jgi:hypothetical protein